MNIGRLIKKAVKLAPKVAAVAVAAAPYVPQAKAVVRAVKGRKKARGE